MDNAEETMKLAIEIRERSSNLILTLSTGSIGYVVYITNEASVSWSLLLIGLAVICWGYSILRGLKYSAVLNDLSIGLGDSFVAISKGDRAEIIKAQDQVIASEKVSTQVMNSQKIYFFIGVLLFIFWRVFKLF